MRHTALLSAIVVAAFSAPAQVVSSISSAQEGSGAITVSAMPNLRIGVPVTGMPYSAEQVTETVQTLADGTHIRQKQRSETIYRDSQGRTRTERSIGGPALANGMKFVEITDPVAGYRYVLDDGNHVAHRATIEVRQPQSGRVLQPNGTTMRAVASSVPATPVRPAGAPGFARPEIQGEDLGTQVIEGLNAHGRRTTRTWAVDSIGNDRPIVATTETWISDQLGGVMVLSKTDDPRYGETTTALKNVNLAEPDPSLFMPPAGYQITEDAGPFRVTVPRVTTTAAQ